MVPRWVVGLAARARALVTPGSFESDLDEEIRFHVREATERNVSRGMSPAEARRAALRDFGGVEKTKEEVRSATGIRLFHDLLQDIRQALRLLKRRRGLSVVIVLTVAVCIAANAAVFSVVDSVLLRPLSFPDSDRLVTVFNSYPGAGNPRARNSMPDLYDRREHVGTLEDVALYTWSTYSFGGEEGSQRLSALLVTPSFFSILRVSPVIGRSFSEEDDGSAVGGEVIISHGFWQSAFGGSADVVGTTAVLEGELFRVVGVLPESFRIPGRKARIFTPLTFTPAERSEAARHRDWYEMIGRLSPGATREAAQSEIQALNRQLMAAYPPELASELSQAGFHTVVRPYLSDLTRDVRTPVLLLWTGVLLVLVIGAANVTSLLVVSARSRSAEMALRTSLGAGQDRILRQLMTETTLMALIGGAGGLLLAHWSLGFLGAFEVYGIPRLADASISPVVILCSLATVVLLGMIAGAGPALAILRRRRVTGLGVGSRGIGRSFTIPVRAGRGADRPGVRPSHGHRPPCVDAA